jgi:hypothetical protein
VHFPINQSYFLFHCSSVSPATHLTTYIRHLVSHMKLCIKYTQTKFSATNTGILTS